MESDYDELIRRMMGQYTPESDFSGGLDIHQGLMNREQVPMAQTGNDSSQVLSELHQKNLANTQNMQALGQDAIQQGMQSSQAVQAQRQAQMDAASQQAAQAEAQRKQKAGQLFGTLLRFYI